MLVVPVDRGRWGKREGTPVVIVVPVVLVVLMEAVVAVGLSALTAVEKCKIGAPLRKIDTSHAYLNVVLNGAMS